MRALSISPVCQIFVLTLIIPLRYVITTKTGTDDIINQTCQTCTLIMPSNFSYNFCSTSLAAIPVSHVTNLAGLGLISLELALENATNTLLTIQSMLSKNESSLLYNSCLDSCMELYAIMSAKLEECVGEYMAGDLDDIYLWIRALMQGASICEDEFEGKGLKSPLTKENYSLSQLCSMVLCTIDLISQKLKS